MAQAIFGSAYTHCLPEIQICLGTLNFIWQPLSCVQDRHPNRPVCAPHRAPANHVWSTHPLVQGKVGRGADVALPNGLAAWAWLSHFQEGNSTCSGPTGHKATPEPPMWGNIGVCPPPGSLRPKPGLCRGSAGEMRNNSTHRRHQHEHGVCALCLCAAACFPITAPRAASIHVHALGAPRP